MISVDGLYHSYSHDKKYAVQDVSFEIAEGEVFGFLGPSGAGKSTTQGVMTGLLQLQKGDVSVAGFDVRKARWLLRDDRRLDRNFLGISALLTDVAYAEHLVSDLMVLDTIADGADRA